MILEDGYVLELHPVEVGFKATAADAALAEGKKSTKEKIDLVRELGFKALADRAPISYASTKAAALWCQHKGLFALSTEHLELWQKYLPTSLLEQYKACAAD